MNNVKLSLLSLIIVSLAGCQSTSSSNAEVITQVSSATLDRQLSISLASCPKGLTPVGSQIVTALVGAGLNLFGQLAKASLENDVSTSFGTHNLHSTNELVGQCISIQREFNGETDLEFMASLEFAPSDNKYMTIVPVSFRYSGTTPQDSKPADRDVAIAIGFASSKDSLGTADKPKGRLINFGTVKQGTEITFDSRSYHNGTQWQQVDPAKPTTLVVQVIETKKPNRLVKYIAKAYSVNEDQIKQRVLELDIWKSQAAIEQAQYENEANSLEQLAVHNKLLDAVDAAAVKLKEVCDSGVGESNVRSAQREYDLALRRAALSASQFGFASTLPASFSVDGKCPAV
ncbi:hypothetical protein ACPV5U_19265 [Vibrio mediterranei]